MTAGARRAMLSSIAMVIVSTLFIGGYLIYHKLLMPTPVELGTGGPVGFESLPPTSMAPPAASEGQGLVAPPPPISGTGLGTPESEANEGAADTVEGTEVQEEALVAAPVTPNTADTASDAVVAADGALTPAMAEAYAKLLIDGSKLQRAGKVQEAKAAYERALAILPIGSGALSKLALLHLDAGQRKKARGYAQRAADLDASNAEAWIVLGSIRQAENDIDGAQRAYAKCAAIADPQYSEECERLIH